MSKAVQKTATSTVLVILIFCVLMTTGLTPAAYAAGDTAIRSSQPIYVDGWSVNITAYSINGANFVRMRDIGYIIDFDVRYDSADDSIRISTKEPYSGEPFMIGSAPEQAVAAENHLPIYVDGQEVAMLAYNIDGSNYVKLRDVGAAVDFSVKWDAARNRVLIDTSAPYAVETPQAPIPEPESDIPGGTPIDYSLQANPAIFDSYFTRAKYNVDRQHVLDTGTNVNWGTRRTPQSAEALNAADCFFSNIAQMSDLEKVYCINDYLCTHVTYRLDATFIGDDFWTTMAYGVCEDYARAFQYMCYRAQIPCLFMTGIRQPAISTGRHAWNEIYLDDMWQFYDGTMSDSRKTIILSKTSETANTGYKYADNNPKATMYYKEVYVPGSTM